MKLQRKENLPAGNFLRAVGLGGTILAANACTPQINDNQRIDITPTEKPNQQEGKEILQQTPTEFGFTTHVRPESPNGTENLTLSKFKEHIDQLVKKNMDCVRFDINPGHVAPNGTKDTIEWNEKNLQMYDEAIHYARDKGLKITLVSGLPQFINGYSEDDLTTFAENYYPELAKRYKGMIDTWQILNEPNVHNFTDYDNSLRVNEREDFLFNKEYVRKLAKIVTIASNAIKTANSTHKTEKETNNSNTSSVEIAVNLSRWIGNRSTDDLKRQGDMILDAVEPGVIDKIGLDMYVDFNEREMNKIPGYVEYFKNRGVKVSIAELGLSTYHYSAEEQAKSIIKTISAIMSGKVHPDDIILYEYSDEKTWQNSGEPNEGYFGLVDTDGNEKSSAALVFEKINTIQEAQKRQQAQHDQQ